MNDLFMAITDTIVLPSAYFNWMGYSGFAEASELQLAGHHARLSVRSDRTGAIVEFRLCGTNRDAEGDTTSWTYEGMDGTGNLITLIIFND